jgi:sulfur carrier protein
MIVELNGREVDVPDDSTVADVALKAGIEPGRRGIAIALDGEVVPAARLAETSLRDGQRVEIVEAIGGGAA